MTGVPAPARTAVLAPAISRVGTIRWPILVGGLVVISAALRFVLALTSPTPWIIPDELVYADLAESFVRSGHFLLRGEPFTAWTFGPLYSVAVSPAYLLGSTSAAYVLVKAINAVLFSTAAVPVYLMARRMLTRERALLASALSLLVPSGVYTARVMSESLAYPVFLWATLSLVLVLESPTRRRQLACLTMFAVAVLSRAEMIVLVPALATAVAILAVAGRQRGSRLRELTRQIRALAPIAGVGVTAATLVLIGFATVVSPDSGILGSHATVKEHVRPLHAPAWLIYHLSELELYVGVVPLITFALFAAVVLRHGDASRSARAFVAASTAVGTWLLVLAGFYATQRRVNPHVYDRYIFYVVPLLVIGMLAWFERAALPPRRLVSVVLLLACALPLTLPYGTLLNGQEWGTSSSSVGLLPWVAVGNLVGHGILLRLVILAFVLALAYVGFRGPPESSIRLVAGIFVAVGVLGVTGSSRMSDLLSVGVGSHPDWIDRAVGKDERVATLWPGLDKRGARGAYALWEAEFYNRSIGPLYWLRSALADHLPTARARISPSGRVLTDSGPLRARYVLADKTLPPVGRRVASDRSTGLILYSTR